MELRQYYACIQYKRGRISRMVGHLVHPSCYSVVQICKHVNAHVGLLDRVDTDIFPKENL